MGMVPARISWFLFWFCFFTVGFGVWVSKSSEGVPDWASWAGLDHV